MSTIAGSPNTQGGNDGTGNVALFNIVKGIALAGPRTIFVTEYQGNRIRRIDYVSGDPAAATSYMVSTLAGDTSGVGGQAGYTNSVGTNARFNAPADLCVDAVGNLYVSEAGNQDIRKVTPDGVVSTVAGNNPPNAQGYVDGAPNVAQFSNPLGITIDPAGYLYVADYSNGAIRRISPSGNVETAVGYPSAPITDGAGNSVGTGAYGVTISASGVVYIADYYAKSVRKAERVLNQGSVSGKK